MLVFILTYILNIYHIKYQTYLHIKHNTTAGKGKCKRAHSVRSRAQKVSPHLMVRLFHEVNQRKTTKCIFRYAFAYLVCHALALINVIVNINLLNVFFEGRFTEFGTRWSVMKVLFCGNPFNPLQMVGI